MDELKRLYKIFSPSGREGNLSAHVQGRLSALGIPYTVDKHHQIYRITPGRPLICAHMDQVQRAGCNTVLDHDGALYGMTDHQQVGLGADDKNGVWLILQLLKEFPDLSFILTTQEESGGKLSNLLPDLDLGSIPYGLIFDRNGSGDIIGTGNDYCAEDLEGDIAAIGKRYGYKPAEGIFSDCDALSEFVPCVNLSCGYYRAHTDGEYTIFADLQKALALARDLIENLPGARYELAPTGPERWATGSCKWFDGLNFAEDPGEVPELCDEFILYLTADGLYIAEPEDVETMELLADGPPRRGCVIEIPFQQDTVLIDNLDGTLTAYLEDGATGALVELDIIEL